MHYAWTKDIHSDATTEAQIQAMIYNFGIHIETKLLNDDIKPKSEGTRLPATDDLVAKVRLLEEQLEALSATCVGKKGWGGRGGRGERGGRGRGREGRGRDTRVCYGCNKKGHIRRGCPEEATANDIASLAVGFPAVVIAPSLYVHDKSIIMSSPPSMCPDSAQHSGLTWDYLRQEYVKPRAFPKILDVQIDTSSGLHYYFIGTINTYSK